MIKSQEVKVFKKTLHCDECKEAPELIFTGVVLASSPLQYPYRCPLCQKTVHTRTTYPKVRHEPVNTESE